MRIILVSRLFLMTCALALPGLLLATAPVVLPADDVALTDSCVITAGTNTKLPCLMLACSDDEGVLALAKNLKYDLEFTDQLAIDLKKTDHEPTEHVMKKLFTQGTSLAITVKPLALAQDKQRGKVRVTARDTDSNQTLVNELFSYGKHTAYFDSHEIAAKLQPALTGESTPFKGTLAYCKQYSPIHKVVCMSDVAGKHEQIVVPNLTLSVAPRWHTQAPVLLYSQFTRSNTKLMSVNVHNCKQRTLCSYDGLTMQPSFSDDGKQVALCMSGKRGNTEIYLYDQTESRLKRKRVYKQMTHNGGANTSPCLLPNGDIIFCSDFQTGNPQIYRLDTKKHVTHRLTNGKGYCAAPSYHAGSNSVVFTKLVDGAYQLFSLNLDGRVRREVQLTTGAGDKNDPAWSPCGRFVAFTYDLVNPTTAKRIPQIGILNCASKSIRIVTNSKQPKSFPAWIDKPFYAA